VPPRNWKIRVTDILQSIERIERYTRGIAVIEFEKDEKTFDAVIRNFTVIGEAAARVPEEVRASHTDIPWSKMVGMRNFLVHEYFGISVAVLWNTATSDLPDIKAPLQKLLKASAAKRRMRSGAAKKSTKPTKKSAKKRSPSAGKV